MKNLVGGCGWFSSHSNSNRNGPSLGQRHLLGLLPFRTCDCSISSTDDSRVWTVSAPNGSDVREFVVLLCSVSLSKNNTVDLCVSNVMF